MDGGTGATIDWTGAPAGINTTLRVTAPLATVVLSSGMTAPVTLDYGSLFIKGITMVSQPGTSAGMFRVSG